MIRLMAIALALMLAALNCARAGATSTPGVCSDECASCQVLYTVVLGSFDEFDPNDSLCVRVFSAALARLSAVTSEDIDHYAQQFALDRAALAEQLYAAMAYCLWADVIIAPDAEDEATSQARRVLMLFINPSSEANASAQMAAIRSNASLDSLSIIAQSAQVPLEFVIYLIQRQSSFGL